MAHASDAEHKWLLACGIGVFVTLPLATIVMVFAYEDIFTAVRQRTGAGPGTTPASLKV